MMAAKQRPSRRSLENTVTRETNKRPRIKPQESTKVRRREKRETNDVEKEIQE